MHSTKTEILALLKRSDGATVEEISSSIGLASMTVRQQLVALERDALVSAHEVRRPTGRPHYRYQLTNEGHRRIAQGYDRLLSLLLDAVGAPDVPDGRQARRDVFRAAAELLARRHQAELEQAGPRERVERALAILQQHGGFAEFHERDGVFELQDFACAYRAAVGVEGPCEWHETFLRAVLGELVEPAPALENHGTACRYVVPARVPATVLRGKA
jgi:predicted ArsR family transcriptional regulator